MIVKSILSGEKMSFLYNVGEGIYKNWLLYEDGFDRRFLGKVEAVMCLGNGYLGLRSTNEETSSCKTRNLFISGTFNKFSEDEVTELPNAADITELEIEINGESFSLEKGQIIKYSKVLNIKDAEITRNIVWSNSKDEQFELVFRRFVSLENLHLICMKVDIKPLNCSAEIKITSGINAQITNSGSQHFREGNKRFYDKRYIELLQTTTESDIDFVFKCVHNCSVDEERVTATSKMNIDRRKISEILTHEIKQDSVFTLEKKIIVYTSSDKEFSSLDRGYTGKYSNIQIREDVLNKIRDKSLHEIKRIEVKKFEDLLELSKEKWRKIWKQIDISIYSENSKDQLAVRFALYHLCIMTPGHDNRYGIGAKGLSGEGYKGHSFWDTEIFILPMFIYSNPEIARSLLEYRYLTLNGARKKAEDNGYKGAMYPWESAWMNDGEVTPVWGDVDIITGEASKIWSGFIEQHITSDIAFAVWQYYMITGDSDFMEKYGYEILFDTAKFWSDRLEWNESKGVFEINDVVGPDEYKEHVDNNAFTNYMAHWNIKKAIDYFAKLKDGNSRLFNILDEKLQLKNNCKIWIEKVDKIFLPEPDENLIIAQDDSYLSKKIIDLSKYKKQEKVGAIFEDFNLEQINSIQISKQADIMTLFYLLEDEFTKEIKLANWNYYEPKTLHDSSLSYAIHSILASDIGDFELAYEMFEKASNIDMGQNMKSSDAGIHSASMGGLWQAVVCGFGGVRMLNGKLRISPHLPEQWVKLSFTINWNEDLLKIEINKKNMKIENVTKNNKVFFTAFDQVYELNERQIIDL